MSAGPPCESCFQGSFPEVSCGTAGKAGCENVCETARREGMFENTTETARREGLFENTTETARPEGLFENTTETARQ